MGLTAYRRTLIASGAIPEINEWFIITHSFSELMVARDIVKSGSSLGLWLILENAKLLRTFVFSRETLTIRDGLYNFDVPELEAGNDWLLTGWFLLGTGAGCCVNWAPLVAVGVGRRSATLTVCIAPKAAVFFERFAPGIPEIRLTQQLPVLWEVIVF